MLKNYLNEGLIIDLFGILPFNLIFGVLFPLSDIKLLRYILLISLLRVLRVVTIWRMYDLIDELTTYLKSASYYIILIKAVVIWFNIGHFMSCSWYFYVNTLERNYFKNTWEMQ